MPASRTDDLSHQVYGPRWWITLLFFFYVSCATLVDGVIATRRSRNWLISDWLINYQGGFVRRGLPGEIIYHLWHIFHISPVFWAALFYTLCLAIFFAATWRLITRSTQDFWVTALVVSPAALSFQILHPQAGFRKEVIFFALLGSLLVLFQVRKVSPVAVAAGLTAFMVIGVLSHEALFFYSPYVFAALLLSGRNVKQSIREFSLPLLAGIIAAYVCSAHLGNIDVAIRICSSLGYKFIGPDSQEICGKGAIPYLRYSAANARMMSQTAIKNDHLLRSFPIFAALALVAPVGKSIALLRRGLKKEVGILWTTVATSFLMSLVLFFYGIDWGRWIYIHIVCITLLLLFIDGKARDRSLEIVGRTGRQHSSSGIRRLLAAAFLFAYAALWALPNNLDNSSRMGYVGRIVDRIRGVRLTPTADLPDPMPVQRQE